jgi:hypothetical protein
MEWLNKYDANDDEARSRPRDHARELGAVAAIGASSMKSDFFEEVARNADKNRDRMMDASWIRKAIQEADLVFGVWRDEAGSAPESYPGLVIKGENRLNTYVRLMQGIDSQGLSLKMEWVAIPCLSRDWAAALRCVLGDGLDRDEPAESARSRERGTMPR